MMQVWRGSFFSLPSLPAAASPLLCHPGCSNGPSAPGGCPGHCSWQEGYSRVNCEGRTGQEAEISKVAQTCLTTKPTPAPIPAAEGQDEQPQSCS